MRKEYAIEYVESLAGQRITGSLERGQEARLGALESLLQEKGFDVEGLKVKLGGRLRTGNGIRKCRKVLFTEFYFSLAFSL